MTGEAFLVQLHRHLAIKLYYAEIWTALNKVNPEDEGGNRGEEEGGATRKSYFFCKELLGASILPAAELDCCFPRC